MRLCCLLLLLAACGGFEMVPNTPQAVEEADGGGVDDRHEKGDEPCHDPKKP